MKDPAELLPFQTPNGIITGFPPDARQVKRTETSYAPRGYKPCCRDPRNWRGVGDWETLDVAADIEDFRAHPMKIDPWTLYGYTVFRNVECICGQRVTATEYGRPQPPADPTPALGDSSA